MVRIQGYSLDLPGRVDEKEGIWGIQPGMYRTGSKSAEFLLVHIRENWVEYFLIHLCIAVTRNQCLHITTVQKLILLTELSRT